MENQHQKITGYRELTQVEIDLINEIKAKGAALQNLLVRVSYHLAEQRREASHQGGDELMHVDAAQPARWMAIASTDFQTGLMALTRAVAQPSTF